MSTPLQTFRVRLFCFMLSPVHSEQRGMSCRQKKTGGMSVGVLSGGEMSRGYMYGSLSHHRPTVGSIAAPGGVTVRRPIASLEPGATARRRDTRARRTTAKNSATCRT